MGAGSASDERQLRLCEPADCLGELTRRERVRQSDVTFEGPADPEPRSGRNGHSVVRRDRCQPRADGLTERCPKRHASSRSRCVDVEQVLAERAPQYVALRSQLSERVSPFCLTLMQKDGCSQLFDDGGAEVCGGAGLFEALKD